jgi:hypothetical protein
MVARKACRNSGRTAIRYEPRRHDGCGIHAPATALRRIREQIDGASEAEQAEIRRRWREEHDLIYVRTYTVQAHLRVRRPRSRRH